MHGEECYNIIAGMYRNLEAAYMLKNYSTISVTIEHREVNKMLVYRVISVD